MPPKDEASHGRARQNTIWKSLQQNRPLDLEGSETMENGDVGEDNENLNWKQKLLHTLREWWNCDELLSSVSKSKWTVATAVFLLTVVAYRHRQHGHRPRQLEQARRIPRNEESQSFSSDSTRQQRHRSSWFFLLWKLLSNSNESSSSQRRKIVGVPLSMLQQAARQGLVKKALVGSGEILFQDRKENTTTWKRSQLPPNSPGIQSDLLELLSRNGCDDVSAMPESLASRLAGPLLAALPFVYLALVYKIFKNIHSGGNDMKLLTMDKTLATRFSDVAGLEPIMPEVQEIVYYLRHSQIYHAVGAKPPRGILLHGAPGTGKTLLARAVAGEANAAFLSCSGSEFCEMYVGRGAARVRALFARARDHAMQRSGKTWWNRISSSRFAAVKHPPPTAIIFIDEFDALAKSRSYGGLNGNDERESTLNQLLTEMDGFASSNDVTIILIAATNRADVLDPAILRRFDRQIHVSYPDEVGRQDIFRVHARSTTCDMEEIDWQTLASDAWTANFSGSDLRNVVNDAALLAVRERCGHVQQHHLEQAVQRARAMKVRSDLTGGRGQRFLYMPSNS